MSASDMVGLRMQILANAKPMLRPSTTASRTLPTEDTRATLIGPGTNTAPSNTSPASGELDVVVFGQGNNYTAAIMVGLTPAIEGDSAGGPEQALRKLLSATCELLMGYMPKVGSHQRNIHGGGVFDEDTISPEIIEAQKRAA